MEQIQATIDRGKELELRNLRELLKKVETAAADSAELDRDFMKAFRSAPPNVTSSLDAAVGGGTAGIAHFGMAHLSMFLAAAGSAFQTTKHAPRTRGYCKTRSGARFSITASIPIAAVRLRLRCSRFFLKLESPSSCATER